MLGEKFLMLITIINSATVLIRDAGFLFLKLKIIIIKNGKELPNSTKFLYLYHHKSYGTVYGT